MPFRRELHSQESNFQKTAGRHGLAKVSENKRPKENLQYGIREVPALKPHKYLQTQIIANPSAVFLPRFLFLFFFLLKQSTLQQCSVNKALSPTVLRIRLARLPGPMQSDRSTSRVPRPDAKWIYYIDIYVYANILSSLITFSFKTSYRPQAIHIYKSTMQDVEQAHPPPTPN